MTLTRSALARIDARIRSSLDHEEGVQLVKVPVSEAVWSTWRRYCEAVGVPMGRALSILLHRELTSIVDEDLDGAAEMLKGRVNALDEREAALDRKERELKEREHPHDPAQSLVRCRTLEPDRAKHCHSGRSTVSSNDAPTEGSDLEHGRGPLVLRSGHR